ncbi:MAG: hypothetical protein KIT84_18320 [Labilithrix sp.]|nr:hypothetical protein [Labilithrix sp.]
MRLENGTPKTLTIYGDEDRYMQELDFTSSVDTTTDKGITPVTQTGDMARLDWRGVEMVDEDWRPELGSMPKTYTRSRFYRKAKWMTNASVLSVTPVDAQNRPVGDPIIVNAGTDDKWRDSDDGFVRRFDARQITYGCRAIGDCTGATSFTAQALMQVRDAMHAERRAERIPMNAKKLAVFWSEDPRNTRYVNIVRKPMAQTPYRYGFNIKLDVVSKPANGKYFLPGDVIDYRLTMRDGSGNRLHPAGTLPSYADFATDNIPSGIRYYDGFQQYLTLYYALKHREGNNIWQFSGPTNKVKYSSHVVSDFDFFVLSGATGIPSATVAENGFSAVFDVFPSVAGTVDPVVSTLPNSDIIHVQVPADAKPGTYTFTYKGRRDWSGEALNDSTTVDVQVGQKQQTEFSPKTGKCNTCHEGPSGFDEVLHRNADRRTCYGCHMPLESEPDQALDYRIHLIHTRSNRVPGNPNNCSTCHLTTPSGPPRGFPGVGY